MKRQHAAILLALKPGRFRKCCRECPALLKNQGGYLTQTFCYNLSGTLVAWHFLHFKIYIIKKLYCVHCTVCTNVLVVCGCRQCCGAEHFVYSDSAVGSCFYILYCMYSKIFKILFVTSPERLMRVKNKNVTVCQLYTSDCQLFFLWPVKVLARCKLVQIIKVGRAFSL